MNSLLHVDRIQCCYQRQPIVDQLSFTVELGEIACLLGPSGCGKTTVLRAIAGFIPLYSGQIVLNGRVLSSPNGMLVPEKRNIGMVFQDYALFPHLTVTDNIAFGLRGHSPKENRRIVDHLLELVKLPGLYKRYPHELSGGQQQRVALARGLAPRPLLLLMDEPFSNLDGELKRQLYIEVREILKNEDITALLVTHDKEEACAISDKLGILADQQVQQWDTPVNLFCRPCNRQVAGFMGTGQLIAGRVIKNNQVETEVGLINANNSTASWNEGDKLEVFLRPDEFSLRQNDQLVQGVVVKKVFMGTSTLYKLKLASGLMVDSSCANAHELELGEKTGLEVKTRNLVAFKVNGAF